MELTRRLRVRLARRLLKADPRATQRILARSFFLLLVPLALYGWMRSRLAGAVTAFVWVSLFMQLGLFALGIGKESRPENTAVGALQRKFVLPFILSALAGAIYGGWSRGWLWTPLAYLPVAVAFIVLNARHERSKGRQRFDAVLGTLTTVFAQEPDAIEIDGLTGERMQAFGALLDYCESQRATALVIAKHEATRADLTEVYRSLVMGGGNRVATGYQLAALALANPTTLEYLLSNSELEPERKLSDIAAYFDGRPLAWVVEKRGAPDEIESAAETAFVSTAVAKPVGEEQGQESGGDRPNRWGSAGRRVFAGLRWAYRRRQLAAMAGDGRYAELLEVASEAAELARIAYGEDDAPTLHFLALAQKEHGSYAEALRTLQTALDVTEREWNLFANTRLGATERGTLLLQRAEGLRQSAEIHLLMGDDEAAQESVEQALEQLGDLRSRVQMDPEGYAQRETNTIRCLELLGDVHRARGDISRAEPVYRAALASRRNYFGPTHGETALGYSRLASLLDQVGLYDSAQQQHDQAIAILEQIPTFGDVHLPRALLARAEHLHDRGELTGAESDARRALELLSDRALGNSHDGMLAHMRIGMVHASAGRMDPAYEAFTRALDLLDHFTDQVFAVSSERQRQAYLKVVVSHVEIFAAFITQHVHQDVNAVGSLFRILFKYKAIGPELLVAQKTAIASRARPELAEKLAKLTQMRAAIAEIELKRRTATVRSGTLDRLLDARERLERELAVSLPLLRHWQEATSVPVGTLLPPGSTLIELFRGRQYDFSAAPARGEPRIGSATYIACVLQHGRDDAVQLVDLGPAEQIDTLIGSYRASITGEDDSSRDARGIDESAVQHLPIGDERRELRTLLRDVRRIERRPPQARDTIFDGAGRKLTAVLLEPLLRSAGDCRRLFIAPDGDLQRLPFEVLPIGQDRLLIDDDRFRVSYLTTGRDLLRFSTRKPGPSGPPMVVAAPDYDFVDAETDWRGFPFQPLEGTQAEGLSISRKLGVKALLDREALERQIKHSRSPQILHIATHGFFLPEAIRSHDDDRIPSAVAFDHDVLAGIGRVRNPLLRSGLAVAGANGYLHDIDLPDDAEDGLLTAEDVSAMDLLQTDLAVLSACNTGLGESLFGEGVMGLRRAFVLAGARTLMMSLWKVPDAETAELMHHFYTLLLGGMSCSDALWTAQRELRKRYADPYYWGAFICQGDPGPVQFPADA